MHHDGVSGSGAPRGRWLAVTRVEEGQHLGGGRGRGGEVKRMGREGRMGRGGGEEEGKGD